MLTCMELYLCNIAFGEMTRSFRYSDERDFISMNQGRIYCICAFPVGAHIKILPYVESFCATVTYDLMQFLCIKNCFLI